MSDRPFMIWTHQQPEILLFKKHLKNYLERFTYNGRKYHGLQEILFAIQHWPAAVRDRSPIYEQYVSCEYSIHEFAKRYIEPMCDDLTKQESIVFVNAFVHSFRSAEYDYLKNQWLISQKTADEDVNASEYLESITKHPKLDKPKTPETTFFVRMQPPDKVSKLVDELFEEEEEEEEQDDSLSRSDKAEKPWNDLPSLSVYDSFSTQYLLNNSLSQSTDTSVNPISPFY